jgi:RNA polymerase sigma factor (sigma-70 family)
MSHRRIRGAHDYSVNDCMIRRALGNVDDPAIEAEQHDPVLIAQLAASAARLRADVQAELALLQDNQREVLRLIVQEGKTRRETAEALGMPLATLQDTYRRTRERLAERLDAYRPASR